MGKILCTDGVTERLLGAIELRQNPRWKPVSDATTKPATREVREGGKKPVTAAEGKPQVAKTVKPAPVVTGPQPATGGTTVADDEAPEMPPPPDDGEGDGHSINDSDDGGTPPDANPPLLAIGEVIKAIKACKTAEEVNTLIAGDDRQPIKDVAAKHIKKLTK